MKTRILLVAAVAASLIAATLGAASAQETTPAYVSVVNGASTDPVTVTAGTEMIADQLEYATDGVSLILPAGRYDVAFTGGTIDSIVAVDLASGTGETVVSGFGADPATAAAYPVDIAEIDAGMAKITFWNATGAPVQVTVGTDAAVEVAPGAGLPTQMVTADTTLTFDVDGVTRDVATPADSYTDVFAVNDTQTAAIAVSVIPSMTELIAALGGSQVAVPDVVGLAEADAVAAVESAGLVASSTQASSDTVPQGSVVTQDPAPGASVAPGSTVTVTVSTGPEVPATVPVPDVAGKDATAAQADVEAAGLVTSLVEEPSVDVDAGLVIETNPVAGTEVAAGTMVTVVVSSGPGQAVVPDLTGMTQEEATAAAQAANLTVTFVEDPDDPDPDGIIVSQEPSPGTSVEAGTEIVAQLAPAVGDPWAILTLDPKRLLTVTGINFLSGSTVDLSVVDTDASAKAAVEDDGSWVARFDLAEIENETELLLVTGTAADASPYEATFKIPASGSSTDVPTEVPEDSDGIPAWVWIVALIALAAIVTIVVLLLRGRGSSTEDGNSSSA